MSLWSRALVMCVAVGHPALAMGPAAEAGLVVALPQSVRSGEASVTFGTLLGPALRAGFELGDRFNHELALEFAQAMGAGSYLPGGWGHGGDVDVAVTARVLAGRYTFSVDFLGKRGFTPSVGVGASLGASWFRATNVTATFEYVWQPGLHLELHALVGARYTFASGLGLRGYATLSAHGGGFALIPTVGASYRL